LLRSTYEGAVRKKWKKSNDEEALKCWNFELALEAELENKPVPFGSRTRKQTSSQNAYNE
jgi:hypothetical protein